LYMSQRDKALAISQLLHGGYTRLGECADSIASIARNTLQMPAKAEDGVSDKQYSELMEKTKHRMQTIDFTNLDQGMLGHKIPVSLIYSMSYTNSPGPGLQLVNQESGQRSRTSQMLSRLSKTRVDAIVSAESCFRVVKIDGTDKKTALKKNSIKSA